MSITTILPEKEVCSSKDKIYVLYMLKEYADYPVEISSISETLRIPVWRVERVISDLEGYIASDDGTECGYLHKATCSSKAVYIT
ncbi:MAG: hypothetical protein HZB44_02350 [Actinobacteria bacterium]|nr:hypothetical protein [Actinomycetota bacterium]